jgi:hypothetical protein
MVRRAIGDLLGAGVRQSLDFALLSVCSTWCKHYVAYAVLGGCSPLCKNYLVYGVLGGCSTGCLLYSVLTHDDCVER